MFAPRPTSGTRQDFAVVQTKQPTPSGASLDLVESEVKDLLFYHSTAAEVNRRFTQFTTPNTSPTQNPADAVEEIRATVDLATDDATWKAIDDLANSLAMNPPPRSTNGGLAEDTDALIKEIEQSIEVTASCPMHAVRCVSLISVSFLPAAGNPAEQVIRIPEPIDCHCDHDLG